MKSIIGKQFVIAGMTIEVIADCGERYETLNVTTKETVYMDKQILEGAIRLGKAEELSNNRGQSPIN